LGFDDIADLVLLNGEVVTVDEENMKAEAVAVKMNKIVKVGTSEEVKTLVGEGTRVIDLKGRVVLPGLIDSHTHMLSGAAKVMDSRRLDCRDFYHPEIRSIDDILTRIREFSEKLQEGTWIPVDGSPMQPFRMKDKRIPTSLDLDKATTKHPVYVTFGAHTSVANTLALELAGITRETQDPVGGSIDRDESGEPTGILNEKARPLVANLMFPGGREWNEDFIKHNLPIPELSDYTTGQMKEGLKYFVDRCLERGCTTIHDVVTSDDHIKTYQETLAEGELGIRVNLLVRAYESKIKAESLLELGLIKGFGSDRLKIGSIKMSIDGGITGVNSAFYEPFENDPDNYGVVRIPQDVLDDLVLRFHKAGYQLAVHALGDRAFDMIIDAYEKAITQFPREDHRHRIEHGPAHWLCTPERTERMKRLGLLDVTEIGLLLYYCGDTILEILGPKRTEKAFPFKMLLEEGFKLANGTDAPGYIPVDPLRDIGVCVVRKTWDGVEMAPEEGISVMDAIRIHTINGAYAEFAEDKKGSIEPGKLADMVVLHENIFEVDPEKIKDIQVDYTIMNGIIAYERK
jgi:predicted amidohydrolase YtcJ